MSTAKGFKDPERRFWQLLDSAEVAIARVRSDLPEHDSLAGLAIAAIAVGRVLGYTEAITFVDVELAAAASASTQALLVELEQARSLVP